MPNPDGDQEKDLTLPFAVEADSTCQYLARTAIWPSHTDGGCSAGDEPMPKLRDSDLAKWTYNLHTEVKHRILKAS